ncbi:MAG TPA: gluconolactonase, partial [Verrucomicrobiales bacterium]|nr:gluconolactonase [Verrucomicrobiales bacterium]
MNEKPDSSIFSTGRRNFITGATAAMAAAITAKKTAAETPRDWTGVIP